MHTAYTCGILSEKKIYTRSTLTAAKKLLYLIAT